MPAREPSRGASVLNAPPRHRRRFVALMAALGVAAAAAVGANGAVTVANAARLRQAQQRVVRTHTVLERAQELVIALQGAELSQRAYLLTGEERHLERTRQMLARARAQLDRLAELTAEGPSERSRTDALRPLVQDETARLERLVTLSGQDVRDARDEFLREAEGAPLRELRGGVSALAAQEEQLLAERASASEEMGRTLISAALVGLATSLVLLAAAALAVRARLRERAAADAERLLAERSLARQAELLRENDQRKDEFLAMLSHELRNPLAPIRNSVQLLAKSAELGERERRALAVVDRQSAHLSRLVDDLLDLTRISRGKFRIERRRVDLAEVVRRAVDDHVAVLGRHDLRVELDPGPMWMLGDATRLAQAVGNLLGNAVKFTPEGGRITVSLRRAPDHALLHVEDAGIGIEPPMLERLFEPFSQSERSLARNRGGLGLGLALVRNIVQRHGGSVRAASAGLGKGARLTLELPLQAEIAPAAARPVPTTSPGAAPARPARRILLIEDNLDAAETLAELLTLDGHEVTVAVDGPQGLERARAFEPDLVLCDIGLPGMSGYDVARAFRGDPALRGLRLVALSGYASGDDVQRAAEAGFDRHLPKPPRREQLEELLAEG